jgi:putative ABC transport system permease protein
MRALDRKLLRELSRSKGQVITIALVTACGLSAYISSETTNQSLQSSRAFYYERERFADVFVRLERAPSSLLETISELPGVSRVSDRVVEEVMLDLPSLREPAAGRLISVPERGEPALNRHRLRRGRELDPDRSGEVLVFEPFARANDLGPGDTITVILDGRRVSLRIAGTVLSPEYLYPMLGGELLADEKRAGVLWMSRRALAAAAGMEGAFNDLALDLAPGAKEREVIEGLDRVLTGYGGLGAYGRDRHPSDRFLTQELDQLSAQAKFVPAIFLAVAAFLLNAVLARTARAQREQIASLKALGYSNGRIALHFLERAGVIVLLGSVLGTLLGGYFGEQLTELYADFFRFPVLSYRLDPATAAAGFAISALAAFAGTSAVVLRVAALAPAEAMRPEAPAAIRRTLLRARALRRRVPATVRMIVRNLESRPLRSATSILGISFASMIIILGLFWNDAVEHIVGVQFRRAERADLTVSLTAPVSKRAIGELGRLPGVVRVETARVLPVRLRVGHRARETAIFGLAEGAELRRIIAGDGSVLELPRDGLVLSRVLGEVLRVGAGDTIEVERLDGDRSARAVEIAALADDVVGMSGYMDFDALHRWLGEAPAVSSVLIDTGSARAAAELVPYFKRYPRAASASLHETIVAYFEQRTGAVVIIFMVILTSFAAVIAVGVTYNAARISLAERARDLATLRVLGFTRREISAVLLGELAVLAAIGVPLGLFFGRVMAGLAIQAMISSELFRLPVIISPSTYAIAVLVVLVSTVLSALWVRRGLDRLDLVGVLKARD